MFNLIHTLISYRFAFNGGYMSAQMNSLDTVQANNLGAIPAEWKVNVNDASEIQYWMECWNVSEVELRKAIAEVGTDVSELRIALGK